MEPAPSRPDTAHRQRGLGVYVHFPFCLKKCPYCDFVSFARAPDQIDHAGYADAVLAELETRGAALVGRRVETVFFGGGTPSLWEPAELGRVLAAILARVSERAEDVEITAECNPTSLDAGRARALLAAGVNRLSVGVQALDRDRLEFLGRLHDPDGALSAVRAALEAGVPRVSADLIYAVATDRRPATPEEAADDAARVAALGVSHVSAYALTIEPATTFGELARRGRLPVAPDDTAADAYLAVEAELEARGFEHYEISNYAKPGAEARHNLGYWHGRDYLGLGCGAVGTLPVMAASGAARRYRNAAAPERYVARAVAREDPAESEELLDPETRLRERLMLGLRLRDGIDLAAAEADLGVCVWTPERRRAADRLVARGQLVVEGDRLRVPKEARLHTDGIAARLF